MNSDQETNKYSRSPIDLDTTQTKKLLFLLCENLSHPGFPLQIWEKIVHQSNKAKIFMLSKLIIKVGSNLAAYQDQAGLQKENSYLISLKQKMKELEPYGSDASSKFPRISYLLAKNQKKIKRIASGVIKNSALSMAQNDTVWGEMTKSEEMVDRNLNEQVSPSAKACLFLKNQKLLNQKIRGILEGRITIPNSQCLQCTQVFMKNVEFQNNNPMINKQYGITREQMRDRIFLKKVILSLSNSQSGALICGVAHNNRQKIIGFPQDNEFMNKFIEVVLSILENIFPRVYPIFHAVPVNEDFETDDQVFQSNIVAYRLCLYPYVRNCLHYYTLTCKGFHPLFQMYEFKDELPQPIESFKNKDQLYELILKNRKTIKKNPVCSHYEFCSSTPIQYVPPISSQNCYTNFNGGSCASDPAMTFSVDSTEYKGNTGINSSQDWKDQYESYQCKGQGKNNCLQTGFQAKKHSKLAKSYEQASLDLGSDSPISKYKNKALIVLPSSKKEWKIEKLKNFLSKHKIIFHLEKPFMNSIELCARSVWFFSYEMGNENMKKVMKNFDDSDKEKILVMPIERYLQVNNSRLKGFQKWKQYCSLMLEKYPKLQKQSLKQIWEKIIETKDGEMKIHVYEYQSTEMAIFAYLVMENLQIRPYFIKSIDKFFAK